MLDGGSTRSVVMERRIAHPPERVWRALTFGPLIEEWLMANDFEPVVGHRFTLRTAPGPGWNGVTNCEVLEVDPPRTLAYSWNSSGDEAAGGLRTIVTWTLEPMDGGVLVRLEHDGFLAAHERNYRGAGFGWPKFLDRLVATLNRLYG